MHRTAQTSGNLPSIFAQCNALAKGLFVQFISMASASHLYYDALKLNPLELLGVLITWFLAHLACSLTDALVQFRGIRAHLSDMSRQRGDAFVDGGGDIFPVIGMVCPKEINLFDTPGL